MAILFDNNINYLFPAAIHYGSSSVSGDYTNNLNSTWAITVLSGVQPSAATVTSTWTNYNSTFLAHWQGIVLRTTNLGTGTFTKTIFLQTSTSATAAQSGTASWAIVWPTNPDQATISGSSLPSTQFIVVPVTDSFGNGVVRLSSTTITSGNSYSLASFAMLFGGGSV